MMWKQRCRLVCPLLVLQFLLLLTLVSASQHNASTIKRDVVIIGGGSSGTYAAVRLQQEGKSVAVIERNDRLGGHVNTYVDKTTGKTFDIGVIIFLQDPLVTDYFNYLGVRWANFTNVPSTYADFGEEKKVSLPEVSRITGNETQVLERWIEHLQMYPYLSRPGYHLPSPVPEDLLLPWGDYLAKYNMSGWAAANFYEALAGNILKHPTLYMMKILPLATYQSPVITQVDGNNQAIYDAALIRLGNRTNVFLDTQVMSINRSNTTVEVSVSSPEGLTMIQASQLVMAIPPVPETLAFLDLTLDECDLLGQFNSSYIWVAVILNSGLPPNTTIQNFNPHAALGIPAMPAVAAFIASTRIPNAYEIEYSSAFYLPDDLVQHQMLSSVAKLQSIYNVSSPIGTRPELTYFHNHSPYFFTVSDQAVRDGFYDKLDALQGKRRTFWTGSAFDTEYSPPIWNFTELEILPRLLEALDN